MKILCVGSHFFEPTHHSMGAIIRGIHAHAELEFLGREPRPHPMEEVPLPGYFDPWEMRGPWRPEADLVHGVSAGVISIRVGDLLAEGVPYVVSLVGGADLTRELVDPQLAEGYRRLFRRADAITVPFRQATDALVAAGCPREKIVEIPLGLPSRAYPAHAPRGPRTALWVGRAKERKNRPLALAALEGSRRLERLIAVGDRDGSEAAVPDRRAEFPGALPHAELVELLAASHLLLQTGVTTGPEYDTLPTVVLEALAVGLPVVSTPLEGVKELARRFPDRVLLGETAEELAAACDRLLAGPEPTGSAAVSEAVSATVSATVLADFSQQAAVGHFLGLYRRLLDPGLTTE